MSDKSGNKTVLIIVIVAIVAIGGYFLYKETQTETVGISIGDASISAEIQK